METGLKNLLSLGLCLGFCGLSSCAPSVSPRSFMDPTRSFEADAQDVSLDLHLREFGDRPPELGWHGVVPTAEYLDQAQTLIALGEKTHRQRLQQKGQAWIRNFYQTPETAMMADLGSSPFLNLAAARIEPEVQNSLNEVLLQMESALPSITRHVLALGRTPANPAPSSLEGLLLQAEDFNRRVVAEIPRMKLPPVIAEGFRTELLKTTTPLLAEAHGFLRAFKAAVTLSESLKVIQAALEKFVVTLPPELEKSFQQGQSLGRELDVMRDAQDALSVIVDVWSVLTPRERVDKFKTANPDLYDFLVKQSPKDLACLRTRGCGGGPIQGVVKKVFILPKIRNYGIEKVKSEVQHQALQYVAATVNSFGAEFIQTLPRTFAENIKIAWQQKMQRLTAVRGDLQSYVHRVAGVWAKKILPSSEGKIPGFERGEVKVSLTQKAPASVSPAGEPLWLPGELVGASLSAAVLMLEKTSPSEEFGRRLALAQINKLVALTGYRNTRDQLVPALLAPVETPFKLLDIMNFEEVRDSVFSYRVPDRISLQDPFLAHPRLDYGKDFSVMALAAQIRGLSRMLHFTADWKKSRFDDFLSPIKAQDLTSDAKDPSLQQSLFPKDLIFTLNVGAVSVLLQDLVKNATPVFLLNLEGRLLWAQEYRPESEDVAVMAGVVDFKNGRRVSQVEARAVARFLGALGEFVAALEGVEATRSAMLLEKKENGTRPLDTLLAGKKDVKRLMIALANFLSKKMKTPENLVRSSLSLEGRVEPAPEVLSVNTQAEVIRALIKAYEVSGIEAYLWSAQEIYYGMNRHLYQAKKGFYRDSEGRELSFPERINTLGALVDLEPYLPQSSQAQLQRILEPWLQAVAALR